MRTLVQRAKQDFSFRDLANLIVSQVPSKNWPGEIQAVFSFVQSHVRYSLDTNDVEVIQGPWQTLRLGYGDCDDMAILTATLLECLGHPCCFCAVGFGDQGDYSHVLVICSGAGETEWISVDPTEPYSAGWFPPNVTCDMVAPITTAAEDILRAGT